MPYLSVLLQLLLLFNELFAQENLVSTVSSQHLNSQSIASSFVSPTAVQNDSGEQNSSMDASTSYVFESLSSSGPMISESLSISSILISESIAISPSPTLAPEPKTRTPPSSSSSIKKKNPCPCDLTLGSCDISCCCDAECSQSEKSAFSCEQDEDEHLSHWYCYNQPHILQVNNPKKTSKLDSSGLFCIVQDNTIKKQVYKEPRAVSSPSQFRKLWPRQVYSWSGSFLQHQPSLNKNQMQLSDPILVLHSSSTSETPVLDIWRLPTQLYSTGCEALAPVGYLKNFESRCLRKVSDLATECTQNRHFNAHSYYQDIYFIKLANSAWNISSTTTYDNISVPDNNLTLCDNFNHGCVPVVLSDCHKHVNGNLEPCLQDGDVVPDPSLIANASVCQNITFETHFVIIHDGINGIVSVNVTVVLGDISERDPSFTFTSKVTFQHVKDTFKGHRKSGNPGYLINEPILIASLIKLSQTSETGEITESEKLESKHLTVIRSEGSCSLNGSQRQIVNFGMNLQAGCRLTYIISKPSDTCGDLQEKILQLLFGKVQIDYVGMFGNAESENLSDWIPVVKEGEPKMNLQALLSKGCPSMVAGIDIQILLAKTGSLRKPQSKILGMNLKYFQPVELHPSCSITTSSQCIIAVDLMMTVSFVDVSKPAVTLYAPPPTINARLPYDFFYPFLSNASVKRCASHSVQLFALFFYVYIYIFIQHYFLDVCYNG